VSPKPRRQHIVTNVIPSEEVARWTVPAAFAEPIEVREKQNGSWRVWYADPAWIPCDPRCEIKHKHDREMNWIETHYVPTSYADALDWAEFLAEGREVRIVPYVPLAERNRQRKALTAAT
jgi:hypothetical protein